MSLSPVVTSLDLSSSSPTSSSSTLRPGKKKPIILWKNWWVSWMVRGTTFTCGKETCQSQAHTACAPRRPWHLPAQPWHLKMLLDGDASHGRPDLAENPQCQLPAGLTGALGTQHHLQGRRTGGWGEDRPLYPGHPWVPRTQGCSPSCCLPCTQRWAGGCSWSPSPVPADARPCHQTC